MIKLIRGDIDKIYREVAVKLGISVDEVKEVTEGYFEDRVKELKNKKPDKLKLYKIGELKRKNGRPSKNG